MIGLVILISDEALNITVYHHVMAETKITPVLALNIAT
jgi:hypothetical protein